MKLVDKTLYHWYSEVYKNYKSKSVQISFNWSFHKSIDFDIDIERNNGNIYLFRINIVDFFVINIYKDEKIDHAGFSFNFTLLGLNFEYNNRDVRHWDDDFRNFEYCDIDELNKKYYDRNN